MRICFSILFVIFICSYSSVFAQIYTFNPNNLGCNGDWGTAACWDKNNAGCRNNSNAIPPLGSGSPNNCPVIININHPVNAGSLTFAGSNITLNLGTGGNLNLSGNLNVNKGTNTSVFLNGGELNVAGALNMATGGGNNTAIFNIDGNGVSPGIFVNEINLNQWSQLNIRPNGYLIVRGTTDFASGDIVINNEGFFRTDNLLVQGRGKINNTGNGVLVVDNDIELRGTSELTVTGSAEVEVGGSISVGGNAQLNVLMTGSVRVCGESSTFTPIGRNVTVDGTAFYGDGGCFFILPVEYVYFKVSFSPSIRTNSLQWATAKEWEASHFEIERAVQSTNFLKIAEVKAVGWSDSFVEYTFVDDSLPLSGGNLLYRLKQVDFNGDFEYSKVLSIRVPGVEATNGVWRVFPNPTNGDRFNFELVDPRQYAGEEIQVVLISPSANPIILSGKNTKDLSSQFHEKIANAPKGVYLLQVSWGNKNDQIRVLKH